MRRFLYAFTFFGALVSSPVSAAGISVVPTSLSISQASESQSRLLLRVSNTGTNPAIYSVVADEYSKLIIARPGEFRLEGGEGQDVELIAFDLPPGERQTSVSVFAQDIGKDPKAPKSTVSVPLSLSITPPVDTGRAWLVPLSIALVLLSLAIWLAVILVAKRRHLSDRLLDVWQEQRASNSWRAWVAHYWRIHRLLIVSFICLFFSGGLFVWSLAAQPRQGVFVTSANEQTYTLVLQTPSFQRSYEVRAAAGEPITAFTALQKASQHYTIPLSYNPPNEFGVFVTAIGEFSNGADGKYWVYEINDRQVPLAADRSFLQPGDRLIWKFALPDG